LSQEGLAERAGLSARGVSNLERGVRTSPRPETLRLLGDALALSPEDRADLIAAARPDLAIPAAPASERPTIVSPATASSRPRSLIATPPTQLVGRDADVTRLCGLLSREDVRLVTLTGPGGVGKTRLALAAAAALETSGRFPDGVTPVELAAVHEPTLVTPSIAAALGVKETAGRPLADALVEALRDRRQLLVLDNFEHVLPAAVLVADLLARCPGLAVLVTSRERLHLRGERETPVAPLAVPDAAHATPIAELTEVAAVRLFIERAEEADLSFAVTPGNAPAIAEICRRLDGLPLAIELAAARLKVLSPQGLLDRLAHRLQVLTGGPRDLPGRQQTLRDTIAWSYDLLAAEESRAFRTFAVFADGFRLEAAEAVLQADATTVMTSLVDASLLQTAAVDQETRYVMLETIQDFGVEQLAASGDEDTLRHQHADWCLALVSRAGPVDPVVDTNWFDRLEEERANMVAAMAWLDQSGRLDDLARLLIGTRWLWYPAGREAEGLGWFDRLLARHPAMDASLRADALCSRGHLAQMLEQPDATAWLEDALALAIALDDPQRQAVVTEMLAIMAEDGGDYARGEALFLAARDLYARAGSDWAFLTIDYHLGIVAYGQGDLARAATRLDTTRREAEAVGEQLVPVWTRNFLALIACERGEPALAAALLADRPVDLAGGHWHDLPVFLGTVAVLACARAQYRTAARLLGASARHATSVMLPERAAFDRARAIARRHLGAEAYTSASDSGRRLRREQLEAEITRLLVDGAVDVAPAWDAPPRVASNLSPRERHVLRLLADGLTNREIADALYLSQHTASSHVDHILSKLGVRSRTAAVSFAIRHGLA
jgi:predicted ATPase/DNA-binding CsgD family transcriptional regulator/transcriptional regulator with XRE-family HTH domain